MINTSKVTMKIISAAAVHSLMSFPALIERLKHIFSQPAGVPQRQVFPLDQSSHDAFAVLPAWDQHTIAVKAFTYFPDNPAKSAQLKSLYSQRNLLLSVATDIKPKVESLINDIDKELKRIEK